MILEGHVAPQELALLVVVVEDVEPRRLVPLGVDALVLPLGVVVVAVLELEQTRLGLIEDESLAHRLVLLNACHVAGCEMHDGLDARLVEECSMTVYLSQRRCRRSVDLSGSILRMKKWKDVSSSSRRGSRPFLHHSLACERRICCRSSPSLLIVLGAMPFELKIGGSW